jgi:predicted RNase H-like HicB family nuclease
MKWKLWVLPTGVVCEYNATPSGRIDMTIAMNLTAVYRKVPEGYIAFVEELPGANTQGQTLEEAKANLREAVHLILEANRALAEESLNGQEVIRESISISKA